MMMDATWAVGPVSAPTMTGFGTVGCPESVISEDITDDEIEGMINGLGFFQDHEEIAFGARTDTIQCSASPRTPIDSPLQTNMGEVYSLDNPKCATISPVHLPIITNDTGAVVSIPDLTISNNPDVVKSLNIPHTKDCSNGLPQPPELLTPTSTENIQTMLDHQRETILKNQQIIEAQKSELHGRKHHNPLSQPPMPVISMPTPATALNAKSSACYSLAHAALKKADEQVISGSKIKSTKSGTKRKAHSQPSASDSNAYQKWKLTPEGATKLRAVDLGGGLLGTRNACVGKSNEDPTGKNLTPGELEVRRERNRKHAKKSRLRKKSLTSTLEQSLEVLREENFMLRKRIEEYIAAKKKKKEEDDSASSGKNVDMLLEAHRLRSHEKFIASILATDARRSGKKGTKRKSSCKETTTKKASGDENSPGTTQDKNPPSFLIGRGIVVDEKTLKILKGLSKSMTISASFSTGK